jgi:hypothetical protein
MIVACLALVLACAGSAVAAGTLITSSKQVKKGVLLGSDLHRNTVDGTRITDGSLGAVDLAADARRALTGATGPRGRRGAQGVRGVAGPRGLAGTVLGRVAYRAGSQTLAPGSTGTAAATCPSDLRPVGGGGGSDSGAVVVRSDNVGGSHKGWAVTATNTDPTTPHKLKATVVCAPARSVK